MLSLNADLLRTKRRVAMWRRIVPEFFDMFWLVLGGKFRARIGFAGRIFPVNPNYPSVLNRPCYASPAELPEAPDIAVF